MESSQDTSRRQLAAILFADIMGYTALMHADEAGALHILNRFKDVLEMQIRLSDGEIVQFYGDGCLIAFTTAADAVEYARDVQLLFQEGTEVPVRIGIHMGDIVFREGNVFGDSVNIAARIESMSEPGAVLYSAPIEQQIRNQGLTSVSLGAFAFKNLPQSMEVFALQQDGLTIPDKRTIQGKFETPPTRNNLLRVAVVALLGISAFAAWMIWQKTSGESGSPDAISPTALAIFPFENTSDDAELKYLSDGIPGNLINRLSSVPELKVLARSATFTMFDSVLDLTRVRDLLGADVALTGQVTRLSDVLVVDCQLIDVPTQIQMWGSRIRKHSHDLMALEDSLVAALLHPLQLQLKLDKATTEPRIDIDPTAYDHYMQGRYLSYGSTLEESEKAIDHFRKAIEIEPRYAEAYAAIANEKIVQALFSTASREEIFGEARTASQSALGIDPDLAEANLVRASIAFYGDYDWYEADDAYRKALDANPNDPTTLIRYSAYLGAMGHDAEAISLAQKAVQLDPVSISSLHNLGWVCMLAHDFEQSKRAFAKALEFHPNWIWGHTKKGYDHVFLGECDTASVLADRGLELLGAWGSEVLQATFIWINYRCGNLAKADSLKNRFFVHVEEHGSEDPLAVMFVHYAQKDYDKALDWADKLIEERSPSVYLLIIESFWDEEFFHMPRYQKMLKKIGVQSAQASTKD